MSPAITVIMPCYNAEHHLATSVGSLQAQTSGDWQLIAVDDGSNDSTWTVLQALADADPRITILHKTNAGAGAARNAALPHIQGARLAFLDADDTWHPEFLTRMLAAADSAPPKAIIYCGWQSRGLGGRRDDPFVPPEYDHTDKVVTWLGGCRWPIHAAVMPTQVFREVGGFDEVTTSCADYDLWLRVATDCPLIRVPHVLAYYHHHGAGQITSNRAKIALNHWRVQRKFLAQHPEIARRLGRRQIRALTHGELLARGYVCYWRRDLPAARTIFRMLMKHAYGSMKDYRYMLPALLPERWHQRLIQTLESHPVGK